MSKMKTKSSAKKRFSLTASGKVRANSAFKRHCLSAKSAKMKRQARGTMVLSESDGRNVRRFFLPYGA
jgi:large subunit ribosomal protein L35